MARSVRTHVVAGARLDCRARATMLLLAIVAAGAPTIAGANQTPVFTKQAPVVSATAAESAVYYYSGDSRIDLSVALDQLHVKDGAIAGKNLRSSLGAMVGGSANVESVKGRADEALLHLDSARPTTKAGLQAEARRLSAPGRKVNAVLYPREATTRTEADRLVLTNQVAVRVQEGQSIEVLAKKYGARIVSEVSYSPNTYILEVGGDSLLKGLETANSLYENDGTVFAEPVIFRNRQPRLVPNDPQFTSQWHLRNTGQSSGGVAGNDVNIVTAWDQVTGTGINVSIVDDGLEVAHEDLAANARTAIDIDINYNDADPSPSGTDNHGTSCGGVTAARGNNSIGVTGAAFNAGLVGIRLISAANTDAQEAQAMAHQMNPANAADRVHVSSNSWGPNDDAARLEAPGSLMAAALANGVAQGRGGLGTIYVFAAGNGKCANDNVNYDGYASSPYTIAVGATGANGTVSYYSEPGASMLVNAPSNYGSCTSGATAGITTVDRTGSAGYGTGNYTNTFGGTSSACPLAAGVIALMLQRNPNLGWRDVQHILTTTSTKNDPTNAGWVQNGAGRWFNHSYGYGRINALAAVNAAATWTNLPAQATALTATSNGSTAIPDNNTTGVTRTFTISGNANFKTEHVQLTFNATHTYRGDLVVRLTSPSGMVSTLQELHNDGTDNISNWVYNSVAHFGENPNGTWTVQVYDGYSGDTGTLGNLTLRVTGYIAGGATPTPTPTPTATPTATASPTPTASPSPTTAPTATPTTTPTPTATPTPTPAGETPLTTGVGVAGSVALQGWAHYYIDVPSNATQLVVATTGATADLDLYVRRGAQPNLTTYDFRPYTSSGNETVTVNATSSPTLQVSPSGARYYASVYGYAAGSFTITATYTVGTTQTTVTFTSTAANDGDIRENTETSNTGGASWATDTTMYIGDSASRQQYLGVLSFDTSSLPDTATIVSAEIRLVRAGIAGTPTTLGTLTADVKTGFYGSAVTLANNDFESADTATGVATFSYPTANGQQVTGVLSATGRNAISKTATTQFQIRFSTDDDNDSTADYLTFGTGNHATVSYRPVLVVTYQ